ARHDGGGAARYAHRRGPRAAAGRGQRPPARRARQQPHPARHHALAVTRPLLLHARTWDPAPVRDALANGAAAVEIRVVGETWDARAASDRATVLVMDEDLRRWLGVNGVRHVVDSGAAVVAIGAEGEGDVPADMPGADAISAFVPRDAGSRQLLVA